MPRSCQACWSSATAGPQRRPWSAAWQFTDDKAGTTWHAVLAGDDGTQQLRPGTAEHPAQTGGAVFFADWLMKTKPQDENLLDFRAAMQITGQPVTFSASSGTHQASSIPASIRDLGLQLGLDPEGQIFSFNQVMRLVLQRGIVLTDNRRLPLRRRFPISALSQPADLRDGAAVGAEIFRLKNGGPQDRERFREIQSTFTELTGRELEVRARPAPADDGEPVMIIEPTVAGHHGERPVELSGAGIQEALVLSALLGSNPGRVTVLDEPAVNLEPTVQTPSHRPGPRPGPVPCHHPQRGPRPVRRAQRPGTDRTSRARRIRVRNTPARLQRHASPGSVPPASAARTRRSAVAAVRPGSDLVRRADRDRCAPALVAQGTSRRPARPARRQCLLHQRLRTFRIRSLHQVPGRLRHPLGRRRRRARPAKRPEAPARLAGTRPLARTSRARRH